MRKTAGVGQFPKLDTINDTRLKTAAGNKEGTSMLDEMQSRFKTTKHQKQENPVG